MADSIGGLLGLGGGLLGGILGAGAASGDINTSKQAADQATQKLLDMGAPPDLAKALVLQQYQQAGTLTPEMEQYIQAGPAQTVSQDTGVRDQQLQALNLLSQRANSGLNAQDRANLNQIRTQMASDQQAKLGQIMQNAQARGQAGGGAELAAALSSAQGGANQASQQGDRLAAMASQNALNAASQSGQMAGQLRGQDTSINSQNANIANEMNRFNTQNQIANQRQNVQAQNAANLYNTQIGQNIANANTGQQNQEQQREANDKQQQWLDQFGLANAQSKALQNKSNTYASRGQATANQGAGVGSGLGQLAGMGYNLFGSGGGAGAGASGSEGAMSGADMFNNIWGSGDAMAGFGDAAGEMGGAASGGSAAGLAGAPSSASLVGTGAAADAEGAIPAVAENPEAIPPYTGGMVTDHHSLLRPDNIDVRIKGYNQGGMVGYQNHNYGSAGPSTVYGGNIAPFYNQGGMVGSYFPGGEVKDMVVGTDPSYCMGGNVHGYSTGGQVPDDSPRMGMESRPDKGWGAIIVRPGGGSYVPSEVPNMANGGMIAPNDLKSRPDQPLPRTITDYDAEHVLKLLKGGQVPGNAPVPGDSPKNDTVSAKLSPREIVLPRSVTMHKDAPLHAAAYVAWIKKLNEDNTNKG
jgi:hypothetical protein